MEFIGRQVDFGVASEAVRGTGEAAAEKWFRKSVANVIPRNERVIDDTSFGRLEDAERARSVRRWHEGDVEGILHVDGLGYILLNLYGAVESTTVTGSVTDHEFTLEQSLVHPTLTLFMKDHETRDVALNGGVVSSLEISAATDDYLRYSKSFIAKDESDVTSTPEVDTEYDFITRDIVLKLATTEGGLSGATAVKAKSLNISWNPNVIVDYVFGNIAPDNIYNGAFAIEGSFIRNYIDQTFEDLYKSDDARYMSLVIEGQADIGSGNHPTITLLLNKVMVTDWERAGGLNELVTETVSFKAFYNPTDEQQSKVTLRNLTALYVDAES